MFLVYRDCDTLRLRKVVVELYGENSNLIDRRRMFGPLLSVAFFKKRLARKKARMLRFAQAIK